MQKKAEIIFHNDLAIQIFVPHFQKNFPVAKTYL